MKAKTCEEYVLGVLEEKETALDRCLEENGKLTDAVDYADRVLGVLKQLVVIHHGEGAVWNIEAAFEGKVPLDLAYDGDLQTFLMLVGLIGDEEAQEKRKELLAAKEAAEGEARGETEKD
jgi:hypothetical protein